MREDITKKPIAGPTVRHQDGGNLGKLNLETAVFEHREEGALQEMGIA